MWIFHIFNAIIYDVEDTGNCPEIKDIFHKANANKNVSIEDKPKVLFTDIITRLVKEWPKQIKDNKTKAYRPNILKKDLYHSFQKYFLNKNNLELKDIIKKIKKINCKIGMLSYMELYGKNKPSKPRIAQHNKAQKVGFYLNIDSVNHSVENWIKSLDQ